MSENKGPDLTGGESSRDTEDHQSDSDNNSVTEEPPNYNTNTQGENNITNTIPGFSGYTLENSNSTFSNPNIPLAQPPVNMASRTRKQWDLGRNETINSFESWKGHLMYTLNLDRNFAPFLITGKSWEKKGRNNPLRGLATEQEVVNLELMLGQIANFCSVISRNTILKNSTSLDHVWQHIRSHYGFQSSGSNFLNLCDLHLENDERPEDLFQRIQSFFEFNLLTTTCGISHHGDRIMEDEEMSPTLENIVVFLWLQLLHKDLPGLVKMKYGPDLRSKTLASIKPEISAALDSLLEELGSQPTPILRASTFSPNSYTKATRSNFNTSYSNQLGKYKKPTNPQQYTRPNATPSQPPRRPITCSICKNAGRPSNHFLSSCNLLTPDDKRFLSRARLVSALDDEMYQLNLEGDDQQYEFQHPVIHQFEHPEQTNLPTPNAPLPTITYPDTNTSASAFRVTTCPSPYLNVYVNNQSPVKFIIDTGATVNMIHESTANQFGLLITPSTQTATQADGKSEIEIVGETRFSVRRDDKLLEFEGLVARKMD